MGHASVTRRNNSSTNHLLLLLRLSGSHLNLNLNQKVNLREPLNTQVKFLRLPKKRSPQLKNQQLLPVLKTTKPLLISKPLRFVLFNQLKKLTNSEKPRFNKRKLVAKRPLP